MARRLALLLILAAALAAPAGATVRVVGGAPVECLDPTAWAQLLAAAGLPGAKGIFDEQARTISLPASSCDLLGALGRGYAPHAQLPEYALAEAVFVYGHELQHAAGIADEHAADCGSAHGFIRLARQLGASRAYALELDSYVPLSVCSPLPLAG